MKILIIDANVLFSTLIKNSITAKIVFEEEVGLYTPEFIIDEFLKYQDVILEKTSRTKDEFIQTMYLLKDIIAVVPKEEYTEYMAKAEEISPDKKDTMYFALALKLKCGIWSNDKKLKKQNKIKVLNTKEIIDLFKNDK